jgi:hypothetical protein
MLDVAAGNGDDAGKQTAAAFGMWSGIQHHHGVVRIFDHLPPELLESTVHLFVFYILYVGSVAQIWYASHVWM